MSQIIKVPQMPWQNPADLELAFPDGWQIEVVQMAGYNRPALEDSRIRAAIENPIGCPSIREQAKGKQEVVILFDDTSRVTRVSKIVPFILMELAKAGIPDSRIRFIASSGAHSAMTRIDFAKKLGEDVLKRFPVYNHNAYENFTDAGISSAGTKIYLNAEVMRCDFKIAIGSVSPHTMAGWGGGAKMVLPGVASIETIAANHSRLDPSRAEWSAGELRKEMAEAAALAGLNISVNCLVNLWGETAAIFAGALPAAHEAAIAEAKKHYLCRKTTPKDIVFGNTFAKCTEAPNGLAASASVKNDGSFVLIANAPEGQVVHCLYGPWGSSIAGRLKMQIPIPKHLARMINYTPFNDMASAGWFQPSDRLVMMDDWDKMIEKLRELHGDNAAVAVYPNADIIRVER